MASKFIATQYERGLWSGFGGLRKDFIGNFCESVGQVLHYIKAGNFLTFGGIIVEDTSQDIYSNTI